MAGVVLDRWSRVRVLALANLTRALLITVTAVAAATSAPELLIFSSALIAVALNRLILAALGASLPRTVPAGLLVSGNALAPTLGTAATVAGAGIGLALRGSLEGAGDAAPFAAAAVGYLAAVLATHSFTRDALGPDAASTPLTTAWRDVREGVAAIWASQAATRALLLMGANRLLFGAFTVWTVLVIRFHLDDIFGEQGEQAALAALAGVALAVGLGLIGAALSTPVLVRRCGARTAATVAMTVAALGAFTPLVGMQLGAFLVGWLWLGAGAQVLKITVDTVLQGAIDDALRGRAFIAYDIVFNVAFVFGAVAVALLPASVLPGVAISAGVGLTYLVLALWTRATTFGPADRSTTA